MNRAPKPGILAVAASAGGVQALSMLLGALPLEFGVPVLVVQHLDPRHKTTLADILDRRSALTVKLAEPGERIAPGTVAIAPPNWHLLVEGDGVLGLSDRPREHFVRPSADVLFTAVATAYGPRAIVCVLTGTGEDGATGASAVKAAGGVVVVEDPATALFPGMPEAAIRTGVADIVLPLPEIPKALCDLVEVVKS